MPEIKHINGDIVILREGEVEQVLLSMADPLCVGIQFSLLTAHAFII